MCCAQTAAPKKEKNSHREFKNNCYCIQKALGNKALGAAKTMVKRNPEIEQNPARHVPRPSKIKARRVPGIQNPSKRQPRPAKRCPRVPKKVPRAGPGPPKRAKNRRKAPQSRPRDAKECPRPFQNRVQRAPRPGSSSIFMGSSVRQAPQAILY